MWVKATDGPERQFVITSRAMPARRGHLVALAMDGGTPVGIVNLTTGGRLNFARSSPPALLQPRDVVVPVALLFVSLFVAAVKTAARVFVFAVPLAVIYMPLLMMARGLTNAATSTCAEGILDRIERELGRPSGRR